MTQEQFDTLLTEAQKESMIGLHERSGIQWDEFLKMSHPPTGLCPYVSILNFHGMFVGIESDGYAHT